MGEYRKLIYNETYWRNKALLAESQKRDIMLLPLIEERDITDEEKEKAGLLVKYIDLYKRLTSEAKERTALYKKLKEEVLTMFSKSKINVLGKDFILRWFDYFFSEGFDTPQSIFCGCEQMAVSEMNKLTKQ